MAEVELYKKNVPYMEKKGRKGKDRDQFLFALRQRISSHRSEVLPEQRRSGSALSRAQDRYDSICGRIARNRKQERFRKSRGKCRDFAFMRCDICLSNLLSLKTKKSFW